MFGVVVIYFVFYAARVFGYLASLVINLIVLRGKDEHLSIGSLNFALIGGRIIFRKLRYTTKNVCYRAVDGHVSFRWWSRDKLDKFNGNIDYTDSQVPDQCRLQFYVSGLEVVFFNWTGHYDHVREMAKARQGTDAEVSVEIDGKKKKPTPSPIAEQNIPMLFKLFSGVGIFIKRGAVMIGNHELPNTLVLYFRKGRGVVTAEASRSRLDWYKSITHVELKQVSLRFSHNKDYIEREDGRAVLRPHKVDFVEDAKESFKDLFADLKFAFLNPDEHAAPAVDKEEDESKFFAGRAFEKIRRLKRKGNESSSANPDADEAPQSGKKERDDKDDCRFQEEYACVREFLTCSTCTITQYSDVCGTHPEDSDAYTDARSSLPPEYGTELSFVDTLYEYGPWADQQRALLYQFFYPASYENQEIYVPVPGEERIPASYDMLIKFDGESTIRIPFREPSKDLALAECTEGRDYGWIEFFFKDSARGRQSNMFYTLPWMPTHEGVTAQCEFTLHECVIRTSLNDAPMAICDKFVIGVDIKYPIEWNGLSLWRVFLCFTHPRVFLLAEHFTLFGDMFKDWGAGEEADLAHFIPLNYKYHLRFDDFELITMVNEKNIIDHANDLEENASMTFKGPRLDLLLETPYLKFQSPSAIWKYDLKMEEIDLVLALPAHNTVHQFMINDDHIFMSFSSFRLHGTYQYFYTINPSYLDSLVLNLDAAGVRITLFGFYLRYFLFLKDNYFGYSTHAITMEEYLESLKEGKEERAVVASSTEKANDFEMYLLVKFESVELVLPPHLYTAEQSSVVTFNELLLETRTMPTYMDVHLELSPMVLKTQILNASEARSPLWRGFDMQERSHVKIDSVMVHIHNMYSAFPDYITYASATRVVIGDITGHLLPSQVVAITNWLSNVGHHFADQDNALANALHTNEDPIYSTTSIATKGVSVCIWGHDSVTEVTMSEGIHLFSDTLVSSLHSTKSDLIVNSVVLKFLNVARTDGEQYERAAWQEAASVRLAVRVSTYDRPPDWRQEMARQQDFLHVHDATEKKLQFLWDESVPRFKHTIPGYASARGKVPETTVEKLEKDKQPERSNEGSEAVGTPDRLQSERIAQVSPAPTPREDGPAAAEGDFPEVADVLVGLLNADDGEDAGNVGNTVEDDAVLLAKLDPPSGRRLRRTVSLSMAHRTQDIIEAVAPAEDEEKMDDGTPKDAAAPAPVRQLRAGPRRRPKSLVVGAKEVELLAQAGDAEWLRRDGLARRRCTRSKGEHSVGWADIDEFDPSTYAESEFQTCVTDGLTSFDDVFSADDFMTDEGEENFFSPDSTRVTMGLESAEGLEEGHTRKECADPGVADVSPVEEPPDLEAAECGLEGAPPLDAPDDSSSLSDPSPPAPVAPPPPTVTDAPPGSAPEHDSDDDESPAPPTAHTPMPFPSYLRPYALDLERTFSGATRAGGSAFVEQHNPLSPLHFGDISHAMQSSLPSVLRTQHKLPPLKQSGGLQDVPTSSLDLDGSATSGAKAKAMTSIMVVDTLKDVDVFFTPKIATILEEWLDFLKPKDPPIDSILDQLQTAHNTQHLNRIKHRLTKTQVMLSSKTIHLSLLQPLALGSSPDLDKTVFLTHFVLHELLFVFSAQYRQKKPLLTPQEDRVKMTPRSEQGDAFHAYGESIEDEDKEEKDKEIVKENIKEDKEKEKEKKRRGGLRKKKDPEDSADFEDDEDTRVRRLKRTRSATLYEDAGGSASAVSLVSDDTGVERGSYSSRSRRRGNVVEDEGIYGSSRSRRRGNVVEDEMQMEVLGDEEEFVASSTGASGQVPPPSAETISKEDSGLARWRSTKFRRKSVADIYADAKRAFTEESSDDEGPKSSGPRRFRARKSNPEPPRINVESVVAASRAPAPSEPEFVFDSLLASLSAKGIQGHIHSFNPNMAGIPSERLKYKAANDHPVVFGASLENLKGELHVDANYSTNDSVVAKLTLGRWSLLCVNDSPWDVFCVLNMWTTLASQISSSIELRKRLYRRQLQALLQELSAISRERYGDEGIAASLSVKTQPSAPTPEAGWLLAGHLRLLVKSMSKQECKIVQHAMAHVDLDADPMAMHAAVVRNFSSWAVSSGVGFPSLQNTPLLAVTFEKLTPISRNPSWIADIKITFDHVALGVYHSEKIDSRISFDGLTGGVKITYLPNEDIDAAPSMDIVYVGRVAFVSGNVVPQIMGFIKQMDVRAMTAYMAVLRGDKKKVPTEADRPVTEADKSDPKPQVSFNRVVTAYDSESSNNDEVQPMRGSGKTTTTHVLKSVFERRSNVHQRRRVRYADDFPAEFRMATEEEEEEESFDESAPRNRRSRSSWAADPILKRIPSPAKREPVVTLFGQVIVESTVATATVPDHGTMELEISNVEVDFSKYNRSNTCTPGRSSPPENLINNATMLHSTTVSIESTSFVAREPLQEGQQSASTILMGVIAGMAVKEVLAMRGTSRVPGETPPSQESGATYLTELLVSWSGFDLSSSQSPSKLAEFFKSWQLQFSTPHAEAAVGLGMKSAGVADDNDGAALNAARFTAIQESLVDEVVVSDLRVLMSLSNSTVHFELLPSLHAKYRASRLYATVMQASDGDIKFSAHLFPHRVTFMTIPHGFSGNIVQLLADMEEDAGHRRHDFVLPQIRSRGTMKTMETALTHSEDKSNDFVGHSHEALLTSVVAVEYIQNVVSPEMLNNLLVLQAALTKEIDDVGQAWLAADGGEDGSHTARSTTSGPALRLDLTFLLEGLRLVAVSARNPIALVVESGAFDAILGDKRNDADFDPDTDNSSDYTMWSVALRSLSLAILHPDELPHDKDGLLTAKKPKKRRHRKYTHEWGSVKTNIVVQNFHDPERHVQQATTRASPTTELWVDVDTTVVSINDRNAITKGSSLLREYQAAYTQYEHKKALVGIEESSTMDKLKLQYQDRYKSRVEAQSEEVLSNASLYLTVVNTVLTVPLSNSRAMRHPRFSELNPACVVDLDRLHVFSNTQDIIQHTVRTRVEKSMKVIGNASLQHLALTFIPHFEQAKKESDVDERAGRSISTNRFEMATAGVHYYIRSTSSVTQGWVEGETSTTKMDLSPKIVGYMHDLGEILATTEERGDMEQGEHHSITSSEPPPPVPPARPLSLNVSMRFAGGRGVLHTLPRSSVQSKDVVHEIPFIIPPLTVVARHIVSVDDRGGKRGMDQDDVDKLQRLALRIVVHEGNMSFPPELAIFLKQAQREGSRIVASDRQHGVSLATEGEHAAAQAPTLSVAVLIKRRQITFTCGSTAEVVCDVDLHDVDVLFSTVGTHDGTTCFIHNTAMACDKMELHVRHAYAPVDALSIEVEDVTISDAKYYGYRSEDDGNIFLLIGNVKSVAIGFAAKQCTQLFLFQDVWQRTAAEASGADRPRTASAFLERSRFSLAGSICLQKAIIALDLNPTVGHLSVVIANIRADFDDPGWYVHTRDRMDSKVVLSFDKLEAAAHNPIESGLLHGTGTLSGVQAQWHRRYPDWRATNKYGVTVKRASADYTFNLEQFLRADAKGASVVLEDGWSTQTPTQRTVSCNALIRGLVAFVSADTIPNITTVITNVGNMLSAARDDATRATTKKKGKPRMPAQSDQKADYFVPVGVTRITVLKLELSLFGYCLRDHEWIQIEGQFLQLRLEEYMKDQQTKRDFQLVGRRLDMSRRDVRPSEQRLSLVNRARRAKRSLLFNLPEMVVEMSTFQEPGRAKVYYNFVSSFPGGPLAVNTNKTAYDEMLKILSLYGGSGGKEGDVEAALLESSSDETHGGRMPHRRRGPGNDYEARMEGVCVLEPQISVLGDFTPSVTTILSWLRIANEHTVPGLTFDFLVVPQEDLLRTLHYVAAWADETLPKPPRS